MSILIKPIITEKATLDSEFMCFPKSLIKKVEEVFNNFQISVDKVRTINVRPDRKTKYTKTGLQHGKTNATKKAIVQLAEGETIDLYANI